MNNCDNLDNDCDGVTDESYDDGVSCTDSTCINGVSSNVPNHGACEDGEPCTDDTCHAQFDCVNVADNTNSPDASQWTPTLAQRCGATVEQARTCRTTASSQTTESRQR